MTRQSINLKNNIILIIIIISFLLSCKTITISDEFTQNTIPDDIELILIPAGNYFSGEKHELTSIDYDFSIMKYPVTNVQYITFLKQASDSGLINITSQSVTGYYKGDENWPPGEYEFVDFNDPNSRIGFNPPNDYVIKWRWVGTKQEGYDNHPVTEVTWFGAYAFANFYGMGLPTKEEWEKSARANTIYRFPWGNELDSTKVNFINSGDEYDNDTTPVGYFNGENNTTNSSSPYGLYDMSGNVWEWTNSWKDQSPGKVLKGGSWQSTSVFIDNSLEFYELYTWFEPTYGYSPLNSNTDIGFRCVKR